MTQRVATQSFLFVASFFLAWILLLVLQVVGIMDPQGLQDGDYYVLTVLYGFFIHAFSGLLQRLRVHQT